MLLLDCTELLPTDTCHSITFSHEKTTLFIKENCFSQNLCRVIDECI